MSVTLDRIYKKLGWDEPLNSAQGNLENKATTQSPNSTNTALVTMPYAQFVIQYIRDNGAVNLLNTKFIDAFCSKFPTKAKNPEQYVRCKLTAMVDAGLIKKQKYSLGSGTRDYWGTIPTWCMVYDLA